MRRVQRVVPRHGREAVVTALRLIAHDLVCHRGQREVFKGLSFAVGAGEALQIVGRNGAGKSSLLRMLAGLLRPAEGSISLVGGADEMTLGEQAHYLGHLDALKPSLSVAENLVFWLRFLGGDEAAASSALERVGLGTLGHLPAAYLSAGQRRRLSIARLVAVDRPVWLLDEPTSALDVHAQAALAGLLEEQLAGGGMVLAATHGPLGLRDARELRLGGER